MWAFAWGLGNDHDIHKNSKPLKIAKIAKIAKHVTLSNFI